MFDTVHLVLDAPDVDRVVGALERLEERICRTTGEVRYAGRVGPLRVWVSSTRLKLRGSLSRAVFGREWMHGAPDRSRVAGFVEDLARRLGEDIRSAAVWRADVFADLALSAPLARYLDALVSLDRAQRSAYDGTSVQFNLDCRQVAFYDRAARVGIRVDGGLLRYELRFLNRMTQQMGRRVRFDDLYDAETWTAYANRWEQEYRAVRKARVPLLRPAEPFDWKRHMALTAATSVGEGQYIQFLKSSYEAGRLTRSQYHTARRTVLGALEDSALTAASDTVAELDDAIRRATDQARSAGER